MNTTIRRILATAAAAGVLSLSTVAPAAAEYERGSGPQSPTREGFVDDADLVGLRTGLGALLGLALTGAAVVGIRRHHVSRSDGGAPDQVGDFHTTPRAGLA